MVSAEGGVDVRRGLVVRYWGNFLIGRWGVSIFVVYDWGKGDGWSLSL